MALATVRTTSRLGPSPVNRWRDFDVTLLLATLLLVGFGLVVITSVSGVPTNWLSSFTAKQIIAALLGLVGMVVLTLINYRFLAPLALPIYALNLLLLVLVSRFGTSIGGSTRWFDLGVFLFQPSLFAQLFMILSFGALLARWEVQLRRLPYFLATLVVMGVPAFLVYRQPDLGTALVFGFLWLVMMIASKARRFHLLLVGLASIPAAIVAWELLAEEYMRDRWTIFLHPESDATGQGYNIIQARIAIGNGGLLGEGLAGGSQGQLQFLRVQNIDFIFASASEQFGFIGSIALFVLYIVVLWRCLVIAGRSPDAFGQYICVGVAAVIFFQTVVNIGVNVGLMPVTGLPLPFISYGGSSLLVLLTLQGLVQSVAIRWRKLTF